MSKEENGLNYSKDIKLDKYNLDFELVNGPSIRNKWSKEFKEQKKKRDKAKAKIELVSAEKDEDIRNNWEEYKFDKKPTEAAIKQAIIKTEEFQEETDKFIEANSEAKYLELCLEEFNQKHDNLRGLIKIYLTGYYQESTKIYGEDVIEKKEDNKRQQKIKKKLSKKKTKK